LESKDEKLWAHDWFDKLTTQDGNFFVQVRFALKCFCYWCKMQFKILDNSYKNFIFQFSLSYISIFNFHYSNISIFKFLYLDILIFNFQYSNILVLSFEYWNISIFSFQYSDISIFNFQYLNILVFSFQYLDILVFKISSSLQTFHKKISNFNL